ncbi:unnamed protein product [Linum tenue]|uniref:Uncharacterized protein n=1 Tax=Linum tenue TaxID=586396 RepID=A0AAV0MP91_9ROSI|nr:unnamed protein product [Linum tenue]
MSRWLARVPPSVKPSLTKQDTSMAQGVSYQVASTQDSQCIKQATSNTKQWSSGYQEAVARRLQGMTINRRNEDEARVPQPTI